MRTTPAEPASAAAPDTHPPRSGILVQRVTKTYRRGRASSPALDGIDLEVPAGGWVTLIGPSGCGKSTLLRIVTGLAEPDGGSVEILGRPPRAAVADKQIAYVPQSPALLPWRTALGNVRLPLQVNRPRGRRGPPWAPRARRVPGANRAQRDEALSRLADVGLADAAGRYPSELSGGMQQRVALARAFALGSPVLVMDEPFSALDELTRERLRHQLLGLWHAQRSTVLFVTHSVTEAVTLSDTIVVLSAHPGRVAGTVPVPLGRPRPEGIEDTPRFHDVETAVRRLLRAGARSEEGEP